MFSLKNSIVVSLNEKVSQSVADQCSKLTFPQFKYLFDLSSGKRHDEYDLQGEYTKIINYCNAILTTNNNSTTEYGYPKNKTLGRLQSKGPSIQRIYNGFRGILCDGQMIDYDIKNAHPIFLMNLCKIHNIKYNKLLYYIENRDECLSELMNNYDVNRGQAKAEYLRCINKVSNTIKINKKKIKKNSFFLEFDMQLTEIIKSLYKIYRKDEKFKKYKVSDWNKEGKLMNLVLCDMEDKTLQLAITALIENKIMKKEDIAVLMFDGFMSYNKEKDKVVKFLNEYFKCDGIEWDYKEHNTELQEYINKLDEDGELRKVDNYNGQTIIDIINYMLNGILKNKLIKDDNEYYLFTNERVIVKEKMIKSYLYDLISEQSYNFFDTYKGKEGGIVMCSKIPKHINDIVNGLLDKCPTSRKCLEHIWDFTQYKLFFLNGYFDFKKKEFVNNYECSKANRTFIKINRKFKKSHNHELRDEINKKLFYPIFTILNKDSEENLQLYKYFMYSTAHYLAGDISLKRWSMFQGLRNSGKGIIGDILKNCFQNYVMTTNSGNFTFKKNVQDSQKLLSWLIDYEFVRICLTSEISIYDDAKLDGNMIKKFTSGGDYMNARKNFKDEVEFKIQAGLIITCNDCPPIEPNDALEYCDEYDMKTKFVDEHFDEDEKLNGFTYLLSDNTLKTGFLKREDVIDELTNMFIESYYEECEYPERLRKEHKAENNDENNYTKLKDIFKITNDDKNFIDNKELKVIKNNEQLTFSNLKIKKILKTLGAKEARSGKRRGLSNIVYLNDDDDESDYCSLDSGL